MNTLAHKMPALSRSRLLDWARRALRRMGWRQVLLALALQIVREVCAPLGGIFFLPLQPEGWQPLTEFLDGSWLVGGVPIVYCVLVADEAFDDGVPPLRAFGGAVLVFSAFIPVADWFLAGYFGWFQRNAVDIAWFTQALLFQGSLATSIYAYWRVTQRTMRRAHAAEAERLRNEQRVQTARLLALQSRVEPQMLFDALERVAHLHAHEPQAADALLADLIALLRAMQPRQTVDNNSLEQEFALVEAWIRVNASGANGALGVRLQMAPEARSIGMAPMLVLPLLRAALDSARPSEDEWVLRAHVANHRLMVTLQMCAGTDVAGLSASPGLAPLRERLSRLFGRSARITESLQPPSLTLDLPCLQEDPNDDRADR